jgi:ketosteroid isomerase-like protein
MSQENLDLVVRAMRAVLKRPKPDFETVNALYHPDHVLVPLTTGTLGEAEAQGAEGFKAWLESTDDAVTWDAELRGAVDVGPNKVLAVTLNRFWGKSSGIESVERAWSVVTVADGKITRTATYLDPAKALEAAGLSE